MFLIYTKGEHMETQKEVKQIYVNQVQAAEILGIAPPTIKKWRKKFKDFPKPRIVSPTAVFFNKDEIIDWMEKRRVEWKE